MLKRLSSLILLLVVCGSVLAGTAWLHDEHVCKMAGMEMMPGMETTQGMETMPCCDAEQTQGDQSEVNTPPCCVIESQEPGPAGSTFSPRPPSFSIAVIHPAIVQSPMILVEPYERSQSTQVFLPNLQESYIRNLSFLI